MNNNPKPILAIVTQAIRRDIQQPLRHFSKFRVVHFYFEAPYGDMTKDDFNIVETVKFSSAGDLYRKLSKLHPAIIQGAEPYASRKALLFSRVALKAAKRIGAKYFFPMLENRPARARFGVAASVVKKILKHFANNSDIIFTLNAGARRNLLDIGVPENKIADFLWGVWGVDTKLFTPKEHEISHLRHAQARNDTDRQIPVILYVGRLVEEKGIADILEAHTKIGQIKETQLILIGQGPMENTIKQYARTSKGKVELLGTMPQKNLPEYFRAAAISIYPSVTTPRWEEQIGTVNLQAMACGTPVVSTQSGAIPEYVPTGKVGLLVPEHNPTELAKACLAIINDQKIAKRYGHAGRELVLSKYDTIKNVAKGEQWMEKILK